MEETGRLLKRSARAVGPLRIIAALIAIACVPVVLWSGLPAHGWGVITSQVVPAMVVFIAWTLLFDMLMSQVFAAAHGPESRNRYRTVLIFDAALLATLLLAWGPFYYQVLVL